MRGRKFGLTEAQTMETPLEDCSPRDPKRHATTSACQPCDSGALGAVASLDTGIWTSIIEFLPVPKEMAVVEKGGVKLDYDEQTKHYNVAVSEVVATWRTLLNLRLVSKELALLLHPVDNRALWRRLLLQAFDFSCGGGFNVENYNDNGHRLDIPVDEVNAEEDAQHGNAAVRTGLGSTSHEPTDDQEEQNPQLVAMRGRYYRTPTDYLEEDLQNWGYLDIYHRPSQYGFLTMLQQQPPSGVWPESEDPFSLFGDLVRLLMLPHGDHMVGGGEGSDTTFKYLAAPTERPSSSAYFRFYVMKTLGYVPHFWHWGRGIGGEWKGFVEPAECDSYFEDSEKEKEGGSDEDEEDEEDEDEDDEEFAYDSEFAFPSCSERRAKLLYQNLLQHCQDWRSVCCNEGSDGYTPVFFVGESKSLPHRWIGYMGRKCWT